VINRFCEMKKICILFFFAALAHSVVAQMVPQPLPEIKQVQGNHYVFSWESVPGRVYFIQTSSQASYEDGFVWEFAPDVRDGTGGLLQMGFEANPQNAEFFRLVYSDHSGLEDSDFADFDGDGYSNLQEAMENTDPYDAESYPSNPIIYQDFDGDGISDQDEYVLGLDPETADDEASVEAVGPLLLSHRVYYWYTFDEDDPWSSSGQSGWVLSKVSQFPDDEFEIESPWSLSEFHTGFDESICY